MTKGRNAPGEGTIVQGPDGRWHAFVSMGVKDGGLRDRRHRSGATRAEAAKKMRDLQGKRDAGVAVAAGKAPTVAAWLEYWLDTVAPRRVRPSTLTRYRQLVENQIVPGIGHHRIDKLQPEHVEKLYLDLLTQPRKLAKPRLDEEGKEIVQPPLAPATVNQAHRVLSRALKVAMQRGKIGRNVCTLVDAPTWERAEVEPLTQDEARRLLAVAKNRRNAARWSVALAIGMRQGEVLGMPWADLDLDAGTLAVRQALQRQKGKGLVLVAPKSRAGRRTIALPLPLHDALKAHRAAQLAERLAAGSAWQDHGLVFAQANGRPIDPRGDNRAWGSLLADAGVREAKLHDARHTAATLMLVMGIDPRVVMEILGHSQISLTQGTYQHVVPVLARDAANKMGDALWGP